MTREPHLAGTGPDKKLADYVKDAFQSYGLDEVEVSDYDVLLDFPDDTRFNK